MSLLVELSIENEFWLNKSRIIGNKRYEIVRTDDTKTRTQYSEKKKEICRMF
jgi:hypothetical protein